MDINTLTPYLESEADSTQSIPLKIEEEKLKNINADNGYVYNMKIIYPYLNKYNLCRKIVIHKDNVSNAEILFFYTKKDQDKIDEAIKYTWPLLRFKNWMLRADKSKHRYFGSGTGLAPDITNLKKPSAIE